MEKDFKENNTVENSKETEVKNTVDTETKTNTTDEKQVNDKNQSDLSNVTKTIHPAILIMYGEFLGYVSPLIDMAEKICKGEKEDENIMKLLSVEAHYIYTQMIEDYGIEDIKKWYDDFYGVAFKEYDENIKKAKEKPETKPITTTTNTYPSRYSEYEDWD